MTPQTPNPPDVDGVLDLLREQFTMYRQLSALSERQRSLIRGDRPEQLLEVLSERQRLIDALTGLAERLRPMQAAWSSFRARLGEADAAEADRLVNGINELLEGVLEQDAADAEVLGVRKSEVASALGKVRQSRAAETAYATAGAPTLQGEWESA